MGANIESAKTNDKIIRVLHFKECESHQSKYDCIFNLQAPCVLYIGQAFRYSPENAFYIFNQQIYFII